MIVISERGGMGIKVDNRYTFPREDDIGTLEISQVDSS
jgi:hypothetical protein